MCGIIGYYDYTQHERSLSPASFGDYVDMLAHRGPDGRGIYTSAGIGLGHRRLSIIDLSENASQPMNCFHEQIWITYNGEIYNFQEIRKTLITLGHHFRSTSDTEVLLRAYQEWGVKSIHKIRGIFAFAIWDTRYRRLWLARDHLGVKPLYVADYNGILYFASDISPLLAIPNIPNEPDFPGIDAYFTYSYVPAPLTAYKYIRQVLPGHYLLIEGGRQHTVQYWDIPLGEAKISDSESECIPEFDALFSRIVKEQMVSDVPLGVFLSSGTDSFAVARAMQKCESNPILAFSIEFENKAYDELRYTKMAANALNVNLLVQQFDPGHHGLLEAIAAHCRTPFADSSCLPMYLLSHMTSQHVKVALSGDGADEILAGYPLYRINRYADVYRHISQGIRNGLIKPVLAWLPDIGGKYTWREKARRFMYGAEQGKWRDHASWRVIMTQEFKRRIYTPEFYREVKDCDPVQLYADHIAHAKQQGCSDLEAYLYADVKFYLPNDMLVKVDRMSMAHGLEVRVPFLDVDMVEFCWRLPDALKIHHGTLKYILRRVIADIYPQPLQRLPKSGFNVAPPEDFFRHLRSETPFYTLSPWFKEARHSSAKIRRQRKAPEGFSHYSTFLAQYALYMFESGSRQYPFECQGESDRTART